jgi:Electron transfer DM13
VIFNAVRVARVTFSGLRGTVRHEPRTGLVQTGAAGWRVFDDSTHLDLGPRKGNKGGQNYTVTADVDLSRYGSVTIWCARFDISFGAALLTKRSTP